MHAVLFEQVRACEQHELSRQVSHAATPVCSVPQLPAGGGVLPPPALPPLHSVSQVLEMQVCSACSGATPLWFWVAQPFTHVVSPCAQLPRQLTSAVQLALLPHAVPSAQHALPCTQVSHAATPVGTKPPHVEFAPFPPTVGPFAIGPPPMSAIETPVTPVRPPPPQPIAKLATTAEKISVSARVFFMHRP